MQNKNINLDLEMVRTIKMLAQSYEEISVIKIQKVRDSVLATHNFLAKLSEVFFDVKSSYKDEIEKMLLKSKKHKNVSLPSLMNRNKQGRVAVFLSSNSKLYGTIINNVFDLFWQDITKNDGEYIVVGKYGKELMEGHDHKVKYTYFDLPDNLTTIEQLKELANYLTKFEKVDVYYGKFENMINQIPVFINISGEQLLETTAQVEHKTYFGFEPNLEDVLTFFENQVFSSLLSQTVHEAELARYASRVREMEGALVNINIAETNLNIKARKYKLSNDNRKLIENLAGISLWEQNK